ncbi:MAG TPA: hypothetical protein VKV79_01725, partial [Terriglobia bacterium]|nr:hypothetical protein [Terriglobia bacterium]
AKDAWRVAIFNPSKDKRSSITVLCEAFVCKMHVFLFLYQSLLSTSLEAAQRASCVLAIVANAICNFRKKLHKMVKYELNGDSSNSPWVLCEASK